MNIHAIDDLARAALRCLGVSALFAVTLATAQVGVVGDTGIDSSGNYQQERGWCMVNTMGEDRVTCLKNSAAAQAEKRRGTLDNKGGDFNANAMRRCDVFAGEDRAACHARVQGYGSGSGSVQGGGIIKQVETVVQPESPSTVIIAPKTP